MTHTLKPRAWQAICWHCDGTGNEPLKRLDGEGAISGWRHIKCRVCDGKGVCAKLQMNQEVEPDASR